MNLVQSQSKPGDKSLFLRNRSLRTRLLSMSIALVLIPVLITGAIATLISSQGLQNEIYDQLESVATLKDNQIHTWLQSLQTNLDLVVAAPDSLKNISTLVTNPDSEDVNPTQVRNTLTGYKERSGYFTEIFIMDLDGRVVISTDENQEGKILKTQSFFHEGLLASNITPPSYELSLKNYSIVVSQPLLSRSGRVIGVLAGRANLDALNEIMIQRAGLGETGETYVVNSNNAVLTSLRFEEITLGQTYINTQGVANVVQQKTNGSATYPDYRDITVVGVYHWIPELQIAVLAEQDESEALASVNRLLQVTFGLIIVTVLIATLAAYLITQSITSPISKLAQAAQEISRGNLEQKVEIVQQDEIGVLANSFNLMTSQLRELISGLEGRVADRTKALSTVAEIATATSTILETDTLLTQVVELTKERFKLYHAHIYLLNEEGDTLVLTSGAGEAGRQMVAEKRSIAINREQSLVARAAREKKGVTVNDVTQTPDFLPHPLLPDTHAELAVPMMVGDVVIGVFDVQSEIVGRFTDADIAIQTTLASQVATALQNARSFSKAQSALSQSERLFETSRRLTEAKNLQELTAAAVESIKIPVVNRAIMGVLNYDTEGNVASLDIIANWWNGTGHQATAIGTHYPLEMVRMMEMFVSPTPLFFNDGLNDERVDSVTMQLVQRLNLRAVAVLPLHVGTTQIGVLMLEGEEPHTFTEEETRLLMALGPQIATVLDNRRQFERTQKQAEREAMLNAINQKIQSATSVESVLQIAARELGHALGAPMTIAQLGMKDSSSS